jgi:ribonuclease T1
MVRFWLALLAFLIPLAMPAAARGPAPDGIQKIATAQLPAEAQRTIELIRKGGPFPYDRDGVVFGNFEKQLPAQPRGYYREYTVRTPGVRSRGARRIVAGKGGELYYTGDHYRSFRRIKEP